MSTELKDRVVINERGEKLGKVTDVLFDNHGDPRWAVVHGGVLAAARYVPLTRAFTTPDGRVVVPYDKAMIKHAPKADREHVLSRELETRLEQHYEVEHSAS
jgi:sporulation protein YlmC with PRC-barrel domain